jgi:undecaprenyl diphosphate synthase
MQLFLESLDREVAELDANGVRIRFVGDRLRLAPALLERMDASEEKTAANAKLDLVIAVAYGGRWDIAQAARKLALEATEGRRDAAGIDEDALADRLATAGRRRRTSSSALAVSVGISNFLLWDLAYTELWFTDTLWPDFDAACFAAALADFGGRERRYGRVAGRAGAH